MEDRDQEGEDCSGSAVLAVRQTVPFLRVDLPRELVLGELLFPGREVGSSQSESVDPLPSSLGPGIWVCSECLVILIGRCPHQFPDHFFLPETPGD